MLTGIFHGPFLVKVTRRSSSAEQRFVISGSDSSDGQYPVVPGGSVAVAGAEWVLDLRWRLPETDWQFSLVQQSVAYTVADGLVFTVRGNNGSGFIGTVPVFDHVVVTVTSTNPQLNPMHPPGPPPDFGVPEGATDSLQPVDA